MVRKATPRATEVEVLAACRRRCALCFGLNLDTDIKSGQIAHLDGDASNSSVDNLVYLCLEHHNQFDSTTSQSKGLTSGEVRQFRQELATAIGQEWSQPIGFGSVVVPRRDTVAGHWVQGNEFDSAEIEVEKMSDNRVRVHGFALHGKTRKYGPNIGELDFENAFTNDAVTFVDELRADHIYSLRLRFLGDRMIADEQGAFGYFGAGAHFGGEYHRPTPAGSAKSVVSPAAGQAPLPLDPIQSAKLLPAPRRAIDPHVSGSTGMPRVNWGEVPTGVAIAVVAAVVLGLGTLGYTCSKRLIQMANTKAQVSALDQEIALRLTLLSDSLTAIGALDPSPASTDSTRYNRRSQSVYNRTSLAWERFLKPRSVTSAGLLGSPTFDLVESLVRLDKDEAAGRALAVLESITVPSYRTQWQGISSTQGIGGPRGRPDTLMTLVGTPYQPLMEWKPMIDVLRALQLPRWHRHPSEIRNS